MREGRVRKGEMGEGEGCGWVRRVAEKGGQ